MPFRRYHQRMFSERMTILKSTLIIGLSIITLLSFDFSAHADSISEGLKATAETVRKRLPHVSADGRSSFINIQVIGHTLMYYYKLNLKQEDIPYRWYKKMTDGVKTTACGRSDLRRAMAGGASFGFSYSDARGKLLIEIIVENSDC